MGSIKGNDGFSRKSESAVTVSRRVVLAFAATTAAAWLPATRHASALAANSVAPTRSDGNGIPIGVQTWSVRELLKTAPRETLQRLAELGFTEIEWVGIESNRLAIEMSHEIGFRLVSSQFWNLFEETGSWARWVAAGAPTRIPNFDLEALAADAGKFGFKYLVYSGVATAEARSTLDGAHRFCDLLTRIGRQLADRDIRLLFHPEPPVFMKIGTTTLYDLLVETSDARYVGFEPDVFWMTHIGRDPVREIRRLGGRAEIIHLKDRLKGVPIAVPTDEDHVDPTLFVPVGTGSIDFPSILRAAKSVGTKHYMIEQDEAIGDPVVSLGKSYEYLQSIMQST